ncbi:MAG: CCA-adding enzyme [Chlamydiia bacterium]|nr:CCA-adding enzyme [Chlamydiia bacterium]MCH9616468.1 CCA-adding enzyme [Chlamydiia bacterium]MCH9629546.1 CCA-adding enzyme [Chlamydiia bacterium]
MYNVGTKIVKTLNDAGHTAYFAGGWVRDHLLGHDSDDIDIATSASTEEVQGLFEKTIPVGVEYGIVIVVEEGHNFEIATFRQDRGYADGRRPTGIDPATPEEDAKRRDFTINGMFYDPLTEKLYDFVEGQKDLEKKLIRAIGNPHERFLEDRLRMIRAIRYAGRFGFAIDGSTISAIDDHASTLFPAVAIERVTHEFEKMQRFPNFDEGLIFMHRHFLLQTVFPILKDVSETEIRYRLRHLKTYPISIPVILPLLDLFPDASLEEKLELVDYLKLSKNDRHITKTLHLLKANEGDQASWAHIYARCDAPTCLKLLDDKTHQTRVEALMPHIERIQNKSPIVSARTLMGYGVKPGETMGEFLRKAEALAINENLLDPLLICKRLGIVSEM